MAKSPALQQELARPEYAFERVFDMALVENPFDMERRLQGTLSAYLDTLTHVKKTAPNLRLDRDTFSPHIDPDPEEENKKCVFLNPVGPETFLNQQAKKGLFLHELGHHQLGHSEALWRPIYRELGKQLHATAYMLFFGSLGGWMTGHLGALSTSTAMATAMLINPGLDMAALYQLRANEYAADRFASEKQGDSLGMRQALVGLIELRDEFYERVVKILGEKDIELPQKIMEDPRPEMFRTHPLLENRLAALRNWQTQWDARNRAL